MSAQRGPSAGTILSALSFVFFWSMSSRAMYFSAMPAVGAELGLDAGAGGLVTGIVYVGNVIAVWSSGFLPWSTRRLVPLGIAASVLMQWGFAASTSWGQMMVIGLLGGLAAGVYFPRGANVIAERFPAHARARAMAVHETAATAGLMLGPMFLGAALVSFSWRWAVVAWSVVGLAAVWASARYMPESQARDQPRQSQAPLLLDYRVPALALMGGAMFALVGGFVSALPQLLVVGWGVTPADAASFTGYTRLGGVAGVVLGGFLADRVGPMRLLVWGQLAGILSLLAMASLGYGLAFGVVLIFMTAVVSAGIPAFFALVTSSYRAEERERMFGITGATSGIMGVVLPPVLLGFLMDRWPAPAVVAVVAVAPLMGLMATGWFALRRRRAGEVARAET